MAAEDTPVLVVGAGAIGGYFGSLLAQAGHPVTMAARGPHLDVLAAGTFVIEGGPDAGKAAVTGVAGIAEAPAPGPGALRGQGTRHRPA